jgi:hypothetical protein
MTTQTWQRRWEQHVRTARPGRHFANAIRKYGKDAFFCDVLQEGIASLEAANAVEAFAVELLCTTDPAFGFNMCKGGGTNDRRWSDEDFLEKHREALMATLRARPPKTHCPHGHEYNHVNTYINKFGRKQCVTCNNDRQRVAARARYAPIREANRLKPRRWDSPEWRRKISLAMKARPLPPALVAQATAMKAKTHCPKGHPYDADNTVLKKTKAGGVARICRACRHTPRPVTEGVPAW